MSLPSISKRRMILHSENIEGRILLACEGFEERSLSWIDSQPNSSNLFQDCIIFKNLPERKSRLNELYEKVEKITRNKPLIVEFDRNNVDQFESFAYDQVLKKLYKYNEIIIDISVMSRILIIIIINCLKNYNGNLKIVYSEPKDYAPTRQDFYQSLKNQQVATVAPTSGVSSVVRTSRLSSSIMQDAPSIVVGFTSFNEQLLRALLSSLNPAHLLLINCIPPYHQWRAKATYLVHKDIIDEYSKDNEISDDDNLPVRRSSTLHYDNTFSLLSEIYRTYCYSHRIILSPTGSKMQSLACGLFKICCTDVHIEYPTPESYFFKNFSSSEIRFIHNIEFKNFKENLISASNEYRLNG